MQKKALSLTFLIGSLVTVSSLFLAGEMVLRFGALAGVLLALSYFVAFILVVPIFKLPLKFERFPILRKIMDWFLFVEALFIHLLIGTLIVDIFRTDLLFSVLMSLFFITFLSFFFANWWRQAKNVLLLVNAALLFALAIFLPNYIYLQGGMETVYHNLQHYHPQVLHLEMTGKLQYFALITIILFFKMMMLIPVFQQDNGMEFNKGIRKLFVGILIVTTLVLAFSSMTVVAITKELGADHYNELLLLLIEKQATPFIFFAVIVVLYILTILGILIAFMEYTEKARIMWWSKKGFISIGLTILFSFILNAVLKANLAITVLNVYLVLGSLFSVFAFLYLTLQLFNAIKSNYLKKSS